MTDGRQLDEQLERLVKIAVCPEQHTPLERGSEKLLARINKLVEERSVREKSGTLLTTNLDALLVRADQTLAYPVRDGIAVLLVEAAILLDDDDRDALSTVTPTSSEFC